MYLYAQLWFWRLESWARDISRFVFKVLVLVFWWFFLVMQLVLVNEDEHL